MLLSGGSLGQMTNSPGPKRKHLASSPFKPPAEPTIEEFAVGDRITHDLYGLGRVANVEAHAVTIDFGSRSVRVTSPYAKVHHL